MVAVGFSSRYLYPLKFFGFMDDFSREIVAPSIFFKVIAGV